MLNTSSSTHGYECLWGAPWQVVGHKSHMMSTEGSLIEVHTHIIKSFSTISPVIYNVKVTFNRSGVCHSARFIFKR